MSCDVHPLLVPRPEETSLCLALPDGDRLQVDRYVSNEDLTSQVAPRQPEGGRAARGLWGGGGGLGRAGVRVLLQGGGLGGEAGRRGGRHSGRRSGRGVRRAGGLWSGRWGLRICLGGVRGPRGSSAGRRASGGTLWGLADPVDGGKALGGRRWSGGDSLARRGSRRGLALFAWGLLGVPVRSGVVDQRHGQTVAAVGLVGVVIVVGRRSGQSGDFEGGRRGGDGDTDLPRLLGQDFGLPLGSKQDGPVLG